MPVESIPMWTDEGTMVSLCDVLGRFEANDWRWRVEEFEGVGRFPFGASWAEFDAGIKAGGVVFDWPGIRRFAEGLEQMIDGRIVAVDADGAVVVRIEVFDSTEYEIVSGPG